MKFTAPDASVEEPGGVPLGGKTHLVVTVHGIRTYGHWQEALGQLVGSHDSAAETVHYQFGYFSAIAFLVPFVRDFVVRRFQRSLRRFLSRPYDRVDVVYHSFGTYLVANALMRWKATPRPRIHTLIMAASVLKSNYPIEALFEGTVRRIVNECGVRDTVLILSQLFSVGTGTAGRSGFVGIQDDRFRNRYWEFHHSQYFDREHQFMRGQWLPLLLGDGPIPPRSLSTPHQRSPRSPPVSHQ